MSQKKSSYSIGVDIGGTNTDAVLIDNQKNILAAVKINTTKKIEDGFKQALQKLLTESQADKQNITGIFVGTTHATNAILLAEDLHKVGVIRLAGHQPILPTCYGWPKQLRDNILIDSITLSGGFECDGRELTHFDSIEVKTAVKQLISNGAESLAITGAFAPIDPCHELATKCIVQDIAGEDFPISLSHQIGGIGLIERENATILNAALKKVIGTGFKQLIQVCRELGMDCQVYVTQNNGSLIDLKQAMEYPILTLSAGPTNSFVGGAKLAGKSHAIVVDIGGTSTDVGIVKNGFPRRCLHFSNIGGVSLNFSMPDVLSIAMGGGSHINISEQNVTVGPRSCARQFQLESMAFGGNQLTLTDVAMSLGNLHINGANCERIKISKHTAKEVMKTVLENIHNLVRRIAGQTIPDVILVGGGAHIISPEYLCDSFYVPKHAEVANAYGAALAESAAVVDTITSLEKREETLEQIKETAIQQAVENGADVALTRIIDLQIIPYHYMPGLMARVVVTAAGPRRLET